MAARKTTLEERVEIVKYCIEHGSNYKETAELYGCSYTQVYQWVKKYKEAGEDGLVDRRGKAKAEEELSDLEKLKRESERLKREIKLKEMEIELYRKVLDLDDD